MSRIVLTTIGSLGDLHPFIAIGLDLRDRGHEIVIATTKDYRTKIESLGLTFHSIRPDHIAMDDPKMLSLMMDLQKGTERVVKDYLLANLHQTYADLMDAVRGADFLVSHETIYATPMVAEVLNLRWATCALTPGSFFSAYDPFVLPPFPALAKLRVFGLGVILQFLVSSIQQEELLSNYVSCWEILTMQPKQQRSEVSSKQRTGLVWRVM